MEDHVYYMKEALALARQAAAEGDVPVGCVIVRDGEIIGRGRNRREERGDATAHAELEAIREACGRVGSWRLSGCTLYVTLEPCPMCAGGIINARIDTVRYGAREEKSGCCASVLNLFEERFNHRPRIYQGPLAEECRQLLQEFFEGLRGKTHWNEKI
ncbi:nucleoside deaminase [Flavonifractor sp. An100]|uniref:nucleoside deaminase n=1 Tax=Flavonifractor sp. An100 TaxID=1965538 RepID=UPI000B3ACB76|nr:nucleoside deaminase [Flavonifractor sp. An100]OUQ76878.1 tRNA-specific adenosine deaminase [Flavonifractor sp. An100]